MQPIQQLANGEVAEFLAIDQFDGLSQGKCGYDAVATAAFATKPGQANGHTVDQLHTAAHDDYQRLAGPDISSNQAGMDINQCHNDLSGHGLKYVDSAPDWAHVRAWLKYGYPVIVCITEASVTDTQVGGSPYPWNVAGINHVILATGEGSQAHTIRFRDSANITAPNNLRPMPRDYQLNAAPFWAVVVVEPWLETPPAGFDPTTAVVAPAPAPTPAPTQLSNARDRALLDCWKSTGIGTDADYTTGIARSWQSEASQGRQYGPPLNHEYHTCTWGGKAIVARDFPGARCEWDNGNPGWIPRRSS